VPLGAFQLEGIDRHWSQTSEGIGTEVQCASASQANPIFLIPLSSVILENSQSRSQKTWRFLTRGFAPKESFLSVLHDLLFFFWPLSADDTFFPAALRDKCEAEFASRKDKDNFVEYEFKEYKGSSFYAGTLATDFEPAFRHSAWLRLASKFEHSWDQDGIWRRSWADGEVVQENSYMITSQSQLLRYDDSTPSQFTSKRRFLLLRDMYHIMQGTLCYSKSDNWKTLLLTRKVQMGDTCYF